MRPLPRSIVALAALTLLPWAASPARAAEPAKHDKASRAQPLPRIRLERFIPKLDKPVLVTHDPAGRLFVVEQVGRVLRIDGDGKSVVKTPYLDLSKKVFVEYECGLLGLAFHPKFAENGFLYVNYTAKVPDLKTFVSEFKADPKAGTVDPKTERVVLTIDQPYANHNGGEVRFGPDGMLYIGTGDGGSAHDPHNYGQNPKTLLAKILRIDVTPRKGYAVPKDNPFVGDDRFAPETWAWGLRNPWRFSFDRETGLLYAADVGQDLWEEVDVITRGGNYGWRVREGAHDLHPVKPPPADLINPVFEYSHYGTAASVTGGFVYRGKAIPELRGWYICGDYSQGTIYGVRYENGKVLAKGLLIDPKDPVRNGGTRPTQPGGFGEDIDGELYLCDVNGPVYRVVADAAGEKD